MADYAETLRAAEADIRRIDLQIAVEQDALAKDNPWRMSGYRPDTGIRQLRLQVLGRLREEAVLRRISASTRTFAERLIVFADPNRPGRPAEEPDS